MIFTIYTGITIDLETDTLNDAPEEYIDNYADIMDTAQQAFHSVLHLDQALKEHYNIPIVTVDGKE